MATLPSCVLPDPNVVQLHEIVVGSDMPSITLVMSAIAPTAVCPTCLNAARRIHSHYRRSLADLAWADVPVHITLGVRRFFCDTTACVRRIFTERLPTIVRPWARRTTRLARVQQQIGLIAGGAAGARLCTVLACPVGIDGVLQLVRQYAPPQYPTPRVVGVDDWAMRKGQRYGTILIDHERGHVVDLLPDRTPETLAHWFRDHAGVEIVTRDRAEAYAQGITHGAPEALQVADRWHLIKNLTDALTSVLQDHRRAIEQHLAQCAGPSAPPAVATLPAVSHTQPPPAKPPTVADQQRQARAEQAHWLHERGWSNKRIAQHLQCHPKTIHRYLKRQLPLTVGRAGRQRTLDPYTPYLLTRWNEGCHNAAQLYREIQPQGFTGGCTILRAFIADLRVQSGVPARSRTGSGTPLPSIPKRVPSSRMLAWLSTQPAVALDDEQRALSNNLVTVNPTVATTVQLAQTFATMVRERRAALLDSWIDAAVGAGVAPLRSFANGIRADYAAVRAALSESWSNGRTEGNVNRLKCVKRQMYGRGKLDLLRLRLMHA